jgi:hypothetical protein
MVAVDRRRVIVIRRKHPAIGRRWLSKAAIAAVLLACALPARAQFQQVVEQPYREAIAPKLPVSGHAVVGASVFGSGSGTAASGGKRLHVYFPGKADGVTLRVELNTPDGRFHGSGLFTGSAAGGGWVELTLLSDQQPSLRPKDLPDEELAVAVRTVAAGDRGAPRLLLASWGRPDIAQSVLRLQVNSRRAEIQLRGRSGAAARKCGRVKSASAVRFDTICEIPVAELDAGRSGSYRLTILRRDGFATETQVVELAP